MTRTNKIRPIPSARSQVVMRRTYNRPLNAEGTKFETFEQTIGRTIDQQRWLWERAIGGALNAEQNAELEDLRDINLDRLAAPAGRTLWLGGTEVVKRREASSYNCSYLDVRTVHDVVDAYWLLLQGCGVGLRPINGTLSGFTRRMEVEVVRSTRSDKLGNQNNTEVYDQKTGTWTISVGDSAESWAKSIGKLMAGKFPARKIVLDFSQIRPAGTRLKGYGWICNGDQALSVAYTAICGIMNARVGKLLSKNDIIDVVNWLGTVLSNRRSAQIALMEYGDPEWREFACRKPKGFDTGPHWFRGQSNNSLVFETRPTKKQLREIFELMAENGGSEPGFINAEQAKTRATWFRGVNPCLSADTLVYTADGRRGVTIKQLADEGKDVPVFCVDDSNTLTIRTMRNPRVTGYARKIVRVELDNGESIRVTENHKFRLRSGEYREARDMKAGDSLALLTQYVPETCQGESYADKYVSLLYQANQRPYEHRMIGEFLAGRELTSADHVHHKDTDRLNNTLDNLEVQASFDHLSEHSTGESNGRFCGLDNDALTEKGRDLVRGLGRRFSTKEWLEFARENDLPLHFSEWRIRTLGNIKAFSQRCAAMEGVETYPGVDPRTVRVHLAMIEAGLESEIVDGVVFVTKTCEVCNEPFSVEHSRREQGTCSMVCGNLHKNFDRDKWMEALTTAHAVRRLSKRDRQTHVYREEKSKLGRELMKVEWQAACKRNGVSTEMGRKSSPYPSYRALQEAASESAELASRVNHKIVAVVPDGVEDVYTGTVDDHHNFFVGGWDEGVTNEGRHRYAWINNLQCGEILLPNNGFCNLVELDVSKFKGDERSMHRAIGLIARANYRQTIVNLNDGILQSSWHQQNEYLRLCGVGLTGVARRPDMTHWDFRQLKNSAVAAAYSMADELNLERPKNVTCIKPSGTMSKAFFDTTEGAHRPKARYIINNVSFSRHDPLVPILIDANYKVFDHPTDPGAVLAAFPVSYPDLKFDRWNGHDVDRESAVDQLERYRLLNTSYVEQNTSITVSWDVEESKAIIDWLDRYWDSYVATSFLFRNDPTKTAEDLGYSYLPQLCVTKEEFEEYAAQILPVSIEDELKESGVYDFDAKSEECATGACPVR